MTQEEIQQKAYEVYPLDLDRHMIIEGEPYDNNKEKREAYIRGLTDSKPSLPSDLFIVTPELELTEFEKRVEEICNSYESGKRDSKEQIRYYSAELLDLARKEIMGEWSKGLRDTQDRSGKAYNDGYNFGFEIGYERGKAEALKDLPRWKKCGEYTLQTYGEEHFEYRSDGRYLVAKGMEILLSELKKLPKED